MSGFTGAAVTHKAHVVRVSALCLDILSLCLFIMHDRSLLSPRIPHSKDLVYTVCAPRRSLDGPLRPAPRHPYLLVLLHALVPRCPYAVSIASWLAPRPRYVTNGP